MNRRYFIKSSVAAAVAATLPVGQAVGSLLHMPTKIETDISAVTLEGAEVTLPKAAVQEFSDSLKGKLLLPGSGSYDDARRLLNPSFDKHPALIAQPTGAADVASAVNFARDNELLVAVKCGGHSASGKSSCDNGLQIDLSRYRSVRVDTAARTARVAGGSLLGELDHEAMAHGLVTTAGTVSHTGVGGLTLGGGFGRLGRRFGLTIDNLLEMDIVTPDGQLRRAAPDENPELYWALRGGGGNFGIVTSFLFQLHPMQREVVSGQFVFPMAEAKQVLRFFGEYSDAAPDKLDVNGSVFGAPGGGDSSLTIGFVWSGDPAKVEDLIAPVRKAGTVLKESVTPVDYVSLQRSGDVDDPRANGSYMKSGFIGSVSGAMADDMIDNFEAAPNRMTWIGFQQSGGAIGRVANDATAFAHREAKHNMLSFVAWKHGDDPTEHIRYIRAHWSNMAKYSTGFYHNDLFSENQAAINANYRGNYSRLLAVKKQYDPTNLFRLNANIRPGSG